MNLGRMIFREIAREGKRRYVAARLQGEAAARPESTQVQTPAGSIWMSPIEFKLYEAMRQEGLDPVPQFYIQGYYADFAFPDVRLAVEADGVIHRDAARQQHDRKRDWILRRAGWTVKRFHGTTIHRKASNCAYVIRREVVGRRMQAAILAKREEMRRQARRTAILRPFQNLHRLFARATRREEVAHARTPESRRPESPK